MQYDSDCKTRKEIQKKVEQKSAISAIEAVIAAMQHDCFLQNAVPVFRRDLKKAPNLRLSYKSPTKISTFG